MTATELMTLESIEACDQNAGKREGGRMKDQPATKATGQKPCVCRLGVKGGWLWKPTGKTNAEHQSEYQCRMCGRTEWRAAKAWYSKGAPAKPAEGRSASA